jgi:hypothetical protein
MQWICHVVNYSTRSSFIRAVADIIYIEVCLGSGALMHAHGPGLLAPVVPQPVDHTRGAPGARACILSPLSLSALMDLYIHPLYVLVSKILLSILNSSAPIHPLYYPLSTLSTMGPTVTLSKYIHVWSSFEGFIETNLMVRSKFNLDF